MREPGRRGSSIREHAGGCAAALALAASLAGPIAAAADFWPVPGSDEAPDAGSRWASIADRRAAEGQYAAAAAAYLAAIAAGPTTAAVSTRLGDALMAEGELAGAQAAYREAIAAALDGTAPTDRDAVHLEDRRGRTQDLALACTGMAAALDRAGAAAAARQMVREALAADATASVLDVASMPVADLRIVPDGEVFYRLGLVRQVTGRRAEAATAFREYLQRVPGSRWTEAAQAHLAELDAPAPGRGGQGGGSGPRLLAAATVLATGGVAAPLIDAAWRDQAGLLNECLDDATPLVRPGAPLRLAVEIEVDGRGRVLSAAVKLPAANAGGLARCLERAVRGGLRLPAGNGGRSTRARTELLVGFAGHSSRAVTLDAILAGGL